MRCRPVPVNKSEFRGGVELIYKQLQDALVKLGLRPIPAKDEPFDPHLHQAIEMVDTDDAKDHHVLDELQRGYKLKDRLVAAFDGEGCAQFGALTHKITERT